MIIIITRCNISHSSIISRRIAQYFIRYVCPVDDVFIIPFSPCFSSQLPCVRLISLLIAHSSIPFYSIIFPSQLFFYLSLYYFLHGFCSSLFLSTIFRVFITIFLIFITIFRLLLRVRRTQEFQFSPRQPPLLPPLFLRKETLYSVQILSGCVRSL